MDGKIVLLLTNIHYETMVKGMKQMFDKNLSLAFKFFTSAVIFIVSLVLKKLFSNSNERPF